MTDTEILELVQKLAEPTFRFMLRRIKKEILMGDTYSDMELNTFVSIVVASMVSVDANMLRWIEGFHKIKTNSEMNFSALKLIFIDKLNEQLKVLVR
jgi:hypothetical protein